MKKGLLGGSLRVVHQEQPRGGPFQCCMLVWISAASGSDFHLLDEAGVTLEVGAAAPDGDGLHFTSGDRVVVHDQLELSSRSPTRVKGLAPLACKTGIDAWVLAELSRRELVPAIWLSVRAERERARFRLHLVLHRSSLKQRVHAAHPRQALPGVRPVRRPRAAHEEPWAADVEASLRLIDEPTARSTRSSVIGCSAPNVPLLTTRSPGCWPTHRGDITRFGSPRKLAGYDSARASTGPLTKQPALGADRGDRSRQPPARLPRPLRAHETPARQAARAQSRAGRPRPPRRRSGTCSPATSRSLRQAPQPPSPHDGAHRSEPPIQPCPPQRRR